MTTQLLSEEGFVVAFTDTAGEDQEETYQQRAFEKRFFSDATNRLFCRIFLDHALRDPVSGEVGKSIVFAVSQQHAAKLTQIFNEMATACFPAATGSTSRYRSRRRCRTPSSSPSISPTTPCSGRAISCPRIGPARPACA